MNDPLGLSTPRGEAEGCRAWRQRPAGPVGHERAEATLSLGPH